MGGQRFQHTSRCWTLCQSQSAVQHERSAVPIKICKYERSAPRAICGTGYTSCVNIRAIISGPGQIDFLGGQCTLVITICSSESHESGVHTGTSTQAWNGSHTADHLKRHGNRVAEHSHTQRPDTWTNIKALKIVQLQTHPADQIHGNRVAVQTFTYIATTYRDQCPENCPIVRSETHPLT